METSKMDLRQEDEQVNSPRLTVVMPAYNEEENISFAVDEVRIEILEKIPGSVLLVVNDGSRDKTGSILAEIAAREPRLSVITKTNSGHGPSLVAGLNQARGEFVFLVDSDMQIPLNCFSQLWTQAQSNDAVFGIRENRQDPVVRVILSRLISMTINTIFGIKAVDVNVPCKVFKRQIWNEIYARLQDDGIMAPSMLIPIYARRHGYKTIDIKVPHRARTKGETSLRIVPLVKFCNKGFKQLMRYREKLI
jgi:dolichol-phosphate mannosyltransferase